ncbi:MAG TPA: pantetheine-phosphate adenylyltransferase [Candidatus Krumholzibacteria bacterium]|nr:pantetheine-phosphate adenylyltransferase [Candidatus Krumholzibacteria bacterium]
MTDHQPKRALYPGTFDPLHNGHLDVLERASKLFDEVVVAVAESTTKSTMFSLEQRIDLLERAVTSIPHARVVPFTGMLIHEFERLGVDVVVRGVRLFQDFEYEYTMALMNRRLLASFDVLFLMPSEQVLSLSSSLIKEIHRHGGDVSELVPPVVHEALQSFDGEIR